MKAISTPLLLAIAILLAIPFSVRAQQNFWQPSTGPYGGAVRSLATDSAGTFFAATEAGLYRSRDNAASWSLVNAAIRDSLVSSVVVAADGSVIAGLSVQSIYRSSDGGSTWTLRGRAPAPFRSIVAAADGRLIMATQQLNYSSSDGGATWTWIDTVLPAPPVTKVGMQTASSALFLGSGRIVAGTGTGIHISSDNGATWTESNAGMTSLKISSFATGPSGSIFVGDEHGLHRSTNAGATWERIHWEDSLFTGKFESLAVLKNGSRDGIVFTRFWNRIYRSTDNGLTWLGQPIATNDDQVHTVVAAPDGIVYTSGRNPGSGGTMLRSTDGGVTWQSASPIPARSLRLAVDSIGGIAMYDGFTSIYYSSNNGGRWGIVAEGISATALAFQKNGTLLVTTYDRLYRAEKVATEVWRIDSISRTPILGPTTLSTTSKGAIYVGGNGIYRSADNGRTWTDLSSGLPVRSVSTLGHHPEGWVFAGTLGGSLVRSTLQETGSDVSSVRRVDAALDGVTLEATRYAMGERVSIRYTLPAGALVRLDLISMTGETIASVTDTEARAAGSHSIEIDASGLPVGNSLCRLTVDGASRVVKVGYRR